MEYKRDNDVRIAAMTPSLSSIRKPRRKDKRDQEPIINLTIIVSFARASSRLKEKKRQKEDKQRKHSR
jgi:hypothetical protein